MDHKSMHFGLYPLNGPNIPLGSCAPATNLLVSVTGDIAAFTWTKPHDVLYYILTITETGVGALTPIIVSGQAYVVQLNPNKAYTWTLQGFTGGVACPIQNGTGFNTGAHVTICVPVNVGSVVALAQTDGEHLSWPAVTGATGYKVHYSAQNIILPEDVVTTNTNSVILQNLIPNKIYDFYIDTLMGDGKECVSGKGTFLTAVTSCPVPKPRAILRGTSAIVSWEPQGVQYFDIFLNGVLVASNWPGNLFTFNNLAPSTAFNVTVISKCKDGNSLAGSTLFNTQALPCSPVTAITLQSVVGNAVTVTWPPVTGATGYFIFINGGRFVVVGTSYTFQAVPGVNYSVQVFTQCGIVAAVNSPVFTYLHPFSCPAINIGPVNITPDSTSITIDWLDIPGVVSYEYRFKRNSDPNFGPWLATTNSIVNLTGLQSTTAYNIEIRSICYDKVTALYQVNVVTLVLKAGLKPVITQIDNVTSSGARVHYSVPDGTLYGTFNIRLLNQTTSQELFITHDLTTFDFTLLNPNTPYRILVSMTRDGFTSPDSDPGFFTTCRTAVGPAFKVEFDGSGDIALNILTVPDGVYAFEVWTKDLGNSATGIPADWVKVANLTTSELDYVIPADWQYKAVRVYGLYINCGKGYVEHNVDCPQVRNVTVTVNGNKVSLRWDAIPGVAMYLVHLVSLQGGLEQYYTTNPSINIGGLLASSVYSYTVYAQCEPLVFGDPSIPGTFTTEDASQDDNGCEQPQFSAIVQDSKLANGDLDSVNIDNVDPALVHYYTEVGAGFDRSMIFKDANQAPINITGYGFTMEVTDEPHLNTLLVFSTVDGSIINGGMNGTIIMQKNASQMAALPAGNYPYTLRWTNINNITKPVVRGTITVINA